jgi:hypothetical protein
VVWGGAAAEVVAWIRQVQNADLWLVETDAEDPWAKLATVPGNWTKH